MNYDEMPIQERTEDFAIRVIKAYVKSIGKTILLIQRFLSKQFLRSGTSIGANVSETIYAQSNKDFINKYSIALKEASETRYWIKIMIKSDIVPLKKFTLLLEETERIIKILTSIINKLKAKEK
jgi:four helix bundle protein